MLGIPLRSAAYLLVNGLTGLLTAVLAVVLLATGGALAVLVVGVPFLAAFALLGLPVAAVERWSRRAVDDRPLPAAHRPPPHRGLASWLHTRFAEAATWRELGFALLVMVVLWPVDLLAVTLAVTVPAALLATPVLFGTVGDGERVNVLKTYAVTSWPAAFAVAAGGLVAVAAGGFGLRLLAAARAALARLFLASAGDELAGSAVRLVDAFEAERARIERDLHDGAQQRLVALTMMLGVARLDAPPGPLADQLARAHGEAEQALVELRDLVRGIHPPLLADFGLAAAVADLAARSAVPIDVAVALPQRFPASIESTVYFVVAEALANIAKHAGADSGTVTGRYTGGKLVVEVRDDGRGGADAGRGSGLTGLGDRVSVFDGRLSLHSPPGGPTRVVVEIPCQPLTPSA